MSVRKCLTCALKGISVNTTSREICPLCYSPTLSYDDFVKEMDKWETIYDSLKFEESEGPLRHRFKELYHELKHLEAGEPMPDFEFSATMVDDKIMDNCLTAVFRDVPDLEELLPVKENDNAE